MAVRFDVVVLGLGPAGRATATACASLGLGVAAIDPAPRRPWASTYAAWSDELPDGVPVAARVQRPSAWTTHRHELDRSYAVLDNAALQASLSLDDVEVRVGSATSVRAHEVRTGDGDRITTRVVLDARGATVAGRTQQVAHGLIVPRAAAAGMLGDAQAYFMDWRPAPDTPPDAVPTFLYAVPLDAERVLLEETTLAGRPGPPRAELRGRLLRRLRAHDVALTGDEPVERVRFALDSPLPVAEWFGRTPPVPRLGAAAPLIHPATGFSVANSLRLAPELARAVAGPDPARAAQQVLWSPAARTVHALRRWGLRVLMSLEPQQVPEFFAAFLDMSAEHQRAYLSTRDTPVRMTAAMTAMLPNVSWPLRRAMVLAG